MTGITDNRYIIRPKGRLTLKKFISGVIVGLFLFAGASAFADSASLMGQKVQGLFSVEKDGVKVADAVVINGSTYAPIRAVSEATGTDLSVEGKKIIISTKEVAKVNTTSSVKEKQKQSNIERLNKVVEKMNAEIAQYEGFLAAENLKLANESSAEAKQNIKDSINMLEINIQRSQETLKSAQAQLAELQQ